MVKTNGWIHINFILLESEFIPYYILKFSKHSVNVSVFYTLFSKLLVAQKTRNLPVFPAFLPWSGNMRFCKMTVETRKIVGSLWKFQNILRNRFPFQRFIICKHQPSSFNSRVVNVNLHTQNGSNLKNRVQKTETLTECFENFRIYRVTNKKLYKWE